MCAGYKPTYVKAYETGLVESRQNFILPNDAFPTLQNAYIWRERIKRKQGYQFLGRLRRVLTAASAGNYTTIIGTNTLNVFTGLGLLATEPNAQLELPSITALTIDFAAPIAQTLTATVDTGVLTVVGAGPITAATINFATGVLTITGSAAVGPAAVTITSAYYPSLPVMGLRSEELNNINDERLVPFDQKYAYKFNSALNIFEEFIPGTTWSGNDSDFFWSTNYWVTPTPANNKIFWVTNFSGIAGDPIRYTDGTAWVDFAPTINSDGDVLAQCLAMIPFRGRMVVFNTLEGANLAASAPFRQRIRWCAIGNPISDASVLFPLAGDYRVNAWRDDIRGNGGFLDIPTAENIVSVGFVRDNLVIYCESSTWQLRYTGRSIAPFQIEKVNSELGAESTFSAVQFDTSLVGIGDKGVVECDSFKSNRIDIKIPDIVFQFSNSNNGTKRVHGIRDFFNRLAYWTFPIKLLGSKFPNRRLCYNYENDSWAIFTDSLTTLGNYQPQEDRTWGQSTFSWEETDFTWTNRPALFPTIVGGNQQGYILILDQLTTNEKSLTIQAILGQTTQPTKITSVNHNLQTADIIQIVNIPAGTPFATSLNNKIFSVTRVDDNSFLLYKFNTQDKAFTDGQYDAPATYVGGGEMILRDNFNVVSKKFNFLDDGQTIQFGFCDILVNTTSAGAFTMLVYSEYADDTPVNVKPQNNQFDSDQSDTFFNSVVPTTLDGSLSSSKNWKRVYCPLRASFVTLEYTFSDAQMAGVEQESEVQIDAQVLWMRQAGNQIPFGF